MTGGPEELRLSWYNFNRKHNKVTLEKIISGGQVGADIAALKVAKSAGIETGGFATKDFRTLEGRNPELGSKYGLVELPTIEYRPRTRANVKNSDGTMRFAYNFYTRGERCTQRAIFDYKKPYFDVNPNDHSDALVEAAASWILSNNIKVLNVAGNATYTIESFVERFLTKVIKLLREEH